MRERALGQRLHGADVGETQPPLPPADGLVGDVELRGQGGLGEAAGFAHLGNECAEFLCVHTIASFWKKYNTPAGRLQPMERRKRHFVRANVLYDLFTRAKCQYYAISYHKDKKKVMDKKSKICYSLKRRNREPARSQRRGFAVLCPGTLCAGQGKCE